MMSRPKGFYHTNETKLRISLARIGKPHPRKTPIHSESSKQKQSQTMKKLYREEKLKPIKYWLGKRGLSHPSFGKKYPTVSKYMKNNNPAKREDVKLKISNSVKKLWQNPKYAENQKNHWTDIEWKNKMVRKAMSNMRISPNKPEILLNNILQRYFPYEFKFVGNGEIIIGGKNPDFININGKKQIIELFGNYWHTQRIRTYQDTEIGRIKHFQKYGFNCIVIWQSELKNEQKVIEKIKNSADGNYGNK